MTDKALSDCSGKITLAIPIKLPSLNDYVRACRTNRYAGAKMKHDYQEQIAVFIRRLERFEYPVKISFLWIEANKRRDLDNVAFAKKFILDALVDEGKLKDDNRRFVTGFTDSFAYGDQASVVLTFERSEQ